MNMQLSNRAKNILLSPKYQTSPNSNSEDFSFHFTTDKKLTVKYEATNDVLKNILMESLALLLNNREEVRLYKLTANELENFLRDDNITPAFHSDDLENFQQAFSHAKVAGIVAWIRAHFPYDNRLLQSNFIERNRYCDTVFDKVIHTFELKNDLRFELIEHEFIYYYKNPKANLNEVEKALGIFFSENSEDMLKLVAVYG